MNPPPSGSEPAPGAAPGEILPWVHAILVPIDFSEASWVALRHALPIAHLTGAKITLLNVSQVQLYATEFAHLPSQEHSILRAREHKLQTAAEGRIPPELLAGIVVRHGVPYDEIVKFAEERSINLIVINTHGYTGLRHAMLGSTTEHLVRYAPCPVLVIREHTRAA